MCSKATPELGHHRSRSLSSFGNVHVSGWEGWGNIMVMGIVDFIFPRMCVGCGGEGKYVCDSCQEKLVMPEQICPMCCEPSLDGLTHKRCIRSGGMDRLIVGLPYKGIVQDCLKKVKYKSSWEIIEFLYKLCNFEKLSGCVVVSVPMWKWKEKERGFNQADILGKLVASNFNLPFSPMLVRSRETRPMFGLKKEVRRENIKDAFSINEEFKVEVGKFDKAILVDDVWTTGSTMKECAILLKRSGIKLVWGLALSR